MPQRRRSVGDLVQGGLAVIPWWVAVAVMALLALGVTLALREWASMPGPGGAARQLVFELLRWGLPALWGLCVFWGKRSGNSAPLGVDAQQDMAAVLKGMTWAQFEKLVSEAFRQRRFAVVANGEAAAADDVDMVLRKGGETHLVLCKHWRAERVGVQVLRDLQLTMQTRAAASAYVLTSGHFSDDARAFAKASAIHLVEGPRLSRWLKLAQRSLKSVSGSAAGSVGSVESAAPACPKCQAPMIKRQARRGVHAGSTFWSCTRYPQCHGARPFVAFSGAMSPDP
ncbi:restriction endonuclease [Ideonella paludis]|uniref:Restriction endonuclease n=1 Tax=Ideonella paludis TaxID=1233411 RepID=A0ABS5E2T6_9BURK|nr:restriction endonuclease [Ideonella paludis]